jgi:hypothetical protein
MERGRPRFDQPGLVIPGDTRWYPVIPGDTRWYPVILGDTRWYPVIPGDTRWYPVIPGRQTKKTQNMIYYQISKIYTQKTRSSSRWNFSSGSLSAKELAVNRSGLCRTSWRRKISVAVIGCGVTAKLLVWVGLVSFELATVFPVQLVVPSKLVYRFKT